MTENQESAAKIDHLAEFYRLKEETAVINAKMRASAPLLNSPISSSDALLGIILKELKAMRVEVKEVKEDVKRIGEHQKKMQEDVAEKQEKLHEHLREVKEAQKQFTENQKTIDSKLVQIQEDVASIKQKSQNSIVNDIKQAIFGKWEHIDDSKYAFSAKLEGDKFSIRFWNLAVKEYTLGVKNCNRCIVTVENNKIIQKMIDENGEEGDKYEYHMEDGKLVRDFYIRGVFYSKYIYKRVGDPQFD